jgi:hypothetical protein
MTDQLQFFDAPNGGGTLTKAEAGLAKGIPGHGAERLLAQLVKCGLDREHFRTAAALVLALEEEATR